MDHPSNNDSLYDDSGSMVSAVLLLPMQQDVRSCLIRLILHFMGALPEKNALESTPT